MKTVVPFNSSTSSHKPELIVLEIRVVFSNVCSHAPKKKKKRLTMNANG